MYQCWNTFAGFPVKIWKKMLTWSLNRFEQEQKVLWEEKWSPPELPYMRCTKSCALPPAKEQNNGWYQKRKAEWPRLFTFCITSLSEGSRVRPCSEPSKVPLKKSYHLTRTGIFHTSFNCHFIIYHLFGICLLRYLQISSIMYPWKNVQVWRY